MKKIGIHFFWLVVAEIVFLPFYLFLVVPLAFNDSDYTTNSWKEFFPLLWPLFYFIITIGVMYFVLKKGKLHKNLLNYVYLPIKLLLIFYFLFIYMATFLEPSLDQKVNPMTKLAIYQNKSENESLQHHQQKQFNAYLPHENDYTKLYSFSSEKGTLTFLAHKTNKKWYVRYDYKEKHLIKKMPKVKKANEVVHVLTTSPLGKIEIRKDRDGDYQLNLVSQKEAYALPDEHVYLIHGRIAFDYFLKEQLLSHLNSHTLVYHNDTLTRTGKLGEDLTWVFSRDGEIILERDASNEKTVDLSTLPKEDFGVKGHYQGYLEATVDDTYRKVSPIVYWDK